MSKIYFTSDWHDQHANVIDFCKRPFANLQDMRTALIENYNKKIHSDDTVYFVGDICFGTYEESKELLNFLPGKKILIQGNHDKFSHKQYLSMGFSAIYEEVLIRLFGRRLRISHYPRKPSLFKQLINKKARELRYLDRRPVKDGRWLIHGHTHDKTRINPERKEIHVGVDAWNYSPVSQNEIESLISKAENGKN